MDTQHDYLLIVEDDLDILKLLDAMLTFNGYRVVMARNGREGLEIIQTKRPAIIITDIMMPKLDGFGLVHRLRINPETRDIPVVIMTATYIAPEDREFALNIGATRFIQKPVDLEKFLATIADLMNEDAPAPIEPSRSFNFYDGYRARLETKLGQKDKQIARYEHMLVTQAGAGEDQSIRARLRQVVGERDELKFLLEQIHDQLEKPSNS